MNKLIAGLSCLALLLIINCDNEQPNSADRPSFKKAVARLDFFSESGGTGISYLEWQKIKKVKLSISTDEKGSTPAKYYKDMNDPTGRDLKDVIFPIKESQIQVLLDATSEGKDYYVKTFFLLDDNENILYYSLPNHFKLKTIDNDPIQIEVFKGIDFFHDRLTPEFSVRSVDNKIVFFGFQNYNNHYFDASAEIGLKFSYDNKVIADYKDVFVNIRKSSSTYNNFPYLLPKERSSYNRTFNVEAKVNDYPTEGATHDFIIPVDVSEQIRKGKLILRVSNHPPKLLVNNGKNSININLSSISNVNIPFSITDQDNDETKYIFVCKLFKKSNNEEVADLAETIQGTIFKTGSSISFSTDKLKTKEGEAISQDDLQNYEIRIYSMIYDGLFYSDEIKNFITINQQETH